MGRSPNLPRWLCDGEPPARWDAALGAMIRESGGEKQILLVKRVEREGDPWSGQVALPGGMRRTGENHPAETATREVREEVGIDPLPLTSRCKVLNSVSSRITDLVAVPVLLEGDFGEPKPDGREISSAAWINLSDLRECEVSVDRFGAVPALWARGLLVWGLTYRAVLEVLEEVRRSGG